MRVLQQKLEIMRIWCIFLYHNDHRCIMDHLIEMFLHNREVTIKSMSEFRAAKDILTQLKNGFLISFIENRSQKTEQIVIN